MENLLIVWGGYLEVVGRLSGGCGDCLYGLGGSPEGVVRLSGGYRETGGFGETLWRVW